MKGSNANRFGKIGKWRVSIADLVFLAASFAVIFAKRSQFFSYQSPLNPDEALFAAGAMRSLYGWLNWGMIDPTTSGPLNFMVLTWPRLYDGDITLYSARLTGAVLAGATAGFFYATARQLMGTVWAILATLPCVLFYATTSHIDFVHFNSEQLPVSIIAGSIFFLIRATQHRTVFPLAMAAFLAGLIPFAKLQGLLWAALLGLALLINSRRASSTGARNKQLTVVVFFGILPAALFLIPLVVTGDFNDFVKSYLLQQYLRGTSGVSALGSIWATSTVRALLVASGCVVILCAATVIRDFIVRDDRLRLSTQQVALILFSILSLPIALVSVALPGRPYPHYLQFLIPAIFLWMISALSLVNNRFRARPAYRFVVFFMLGLAGVVPSIIWGPRERVYDLYVGRGYGGFQTGNSSSPRSLSWLRPNNYDTIVCWGWQPECYVDSAMKSATRDGTNENQIYSTALRSYFRSRFLSDFEKSRPDFVVDFVAPGGFVFDDVSKASIETFSEFDMLLKSDFDMISKHNPPDQCPRLYVRKSRYGSLSRTEVEFDAIDGPSDGTTRASAIDDRSTFESCKDYWLLPERTTGTLALSFREARPVKSIAVLNTRNGVAGDRASDRVRISLIRDGRTVATTTIGLNRFPRWTNIEFGAAVGGVNSLTLEILSYFGTGGGLNEVKVYSE